MEIPARHSRRYHESILSRPALLPVQPKRRAGPAGTHDQSCDRARAGTDRGPEMHRPATAGSRFAIVDRAAALFGKRDSELLRPTRLLPLARPRPVVEREF